MALNHEERVRLASNRTIDLTTYGRETGLARRIEIWWFLIEDRFVITGTPARRDWLANIRTHPNVIVHIGLDDIPGTATEVTDLDFRRRVFTHPETRWYSSQAELDRLVAEAPVIEISFS